MSYTRAQRCGFNLTLDDLSPADRHEIERFKKLLGIEASRRAGGDPAVLNMLEQALYPEGIGRPPVDGAPDGGN